MDFPATFFIFGGQLNNFSRVVCDKGWNIDFDNAIAGYAGSKTVYVT